MKKIALFSCHQDPNYGSMLQAYALVEAIRRLGGQSEYINFCNYPDPYTFKRIINRLLFWPLKIVCKILFDKKSNGEFSFFSDIEFADTIGAYKRFHTKYIPVSYERYYYDTISYKLDVTLYDAYMVGSDQSWSPTLYSPNKPYMLDFADLPKRCSYAPSMGTTIIQDDYAELLKNKLSKFDYLSCREKTNSRFLTEVLGREVTHVLDPTLLLKADDWDKIAEKNKIEGEYILAYILGEKNCIVEFAEWLSKMYNIPVYYVVTRPKYLKMSNALNGIGPEAWLGLIRNARYVVTDSFHGCLFSINYNVNFYAFSKREGGVNAQDNARIIEFLSILGINDRFMDDKECFNCKSDINFNEVNKKIDEMRQQSLSYLKCCIDS